MDISDKRDKRETGDQHCNLNLTILQKNTMKLRAIRFMFFAKKEVFFYYVS